MNPWAQSRPRNSRTNVKEAYTHDAGTSEYDTPEYNTLDEVAQPGNNVHQPRQNAALQKEHMKNQLLLSQKRRRRGICLAIVFLSISTIVVLACSLTPTILLLRRVAISLEENQNYLNPDPMDLLEVIPALQILHQNSCYCLYTEERNWFQARDFCHFRRGVAHLAEIPRPDINNFLTPILRAFRPTLAIWLGGSDLEKDGQWMWTTSRTPIEVFTPSQWDFDEPSGQYKGVKEDCLDAFNYKVPEAFLWNDDNCYDSKYFLCQSPLTKDGQCDC